MAKKVFLDTNIVLDLLDKKRENHKITQELIRFLILNGYSIVISEDMLSTIFYIGKNNQDTLKFFQQIILKWEVVPYGVLLIKNAIDLSLEKNLDLEDLLQCLCAKKKGCEVLITEDNGFFDCGIKILTVNEFLVKK